MKPIQVLFLLIVSALAPALAADRPADETRLSFGIVPQQAAAKLARTWTPVMQYLEQETGLRISFKTAPTIPAFEERLAQGEYDFAYMNPYHFTVFNRAPGYHAVARARDKLIQGILVVSKDSPITRIEQLDGATLAFPAPAAFAASVLPRAELKRRGIDFTPKYVSSHDSVYRSVAKQLFPAGGGVQRTFANVEPQVSESLRVLWTTEGYTPHAIAAHPRLSEETVRKVRDALVALEGNARGQDLLGTLKVNGFVAAVDTDWDDVRALRLEQLDELVAARPAR
ncbi:MAG: phosphate/phosphite/phosphonate ABC transporter substrate-binding protein [Gammaproteobacteria bacterium]|nr:phosphate/phosphite/phosphonate ABC transporter substrate-binding protein [Gammaproteobacteria bacterium]